ncbi:MAG: XRE family transcriptional regulator [bacterium]
MELCSMPKTKNDKIFKAIGLLIKKKREELGYTQTKLAELIDMETISIQRFESGYSKIAIDYLAKIAKILKVDINYFFPETKNKLIVSAPCLSESQSQDLSIDVSKYQKVPVYSFTGAGKFIDLTEIEPIDTLFIPNEFYKKHLGVVRVIGPSMEPYIKDGAYVAVDTNFKELVSGYIYCINLDYEGTLIKYVIKSREGITLKSENPKFDDIFIKKDEINDSDHFVIGRVIWVWQNV